VFLIFPHDDFSFLVTKNVPYTTAVRSWRRFIGCGLNRLRVFAPYDSKRRAHATPVPVGWGRVAGPVRVPPRGCRHPDPANGDAGAVPSSGPAKSTDDHRCVIRGVNQVCNRSKVFQVTTATVYSLTPSPDLGVFLLQSSLDRALEFSRREPRLFGPVCSLFGGTGQDPAFSWRVVFGSAERFLLVQWTKAAFGCLVTLDATGE